MAVIGVAHVRNDRIMAEIQQIVNALEASKCRPRMNGKEWKAKCPAHDGNDYDSLSFRLGDDDKTILMHCQSKDCKFVDIINSLGLRETETRREHSNRKVLETYEYKDEHGVLKYRVQKVLRDGKKSYSQSALINGEWQYSLNGVERLLYNLEALTKTSDNIVYFCEGEKDVETLKKLGLTATTRSEGGVSKIKNWNTNYNKYLTGKTVIILQDNDQSGVMHCKIIKEVLDEAGIKNRILSLPDLPEKGDVTDWLSNKNTKNDLIKIVDKMVMPVLKFVDGIELLTLKLAPKERLIDPIIKHRDIGIISSWRGVGKSQVAFSMAAALSTGTKWIKWQIPKPCNVIIIDGEMDTQDDHERWINWLTPTREIPKGKMVLVNEDYQGDEGIKPISSPEGSMNLLELTEYVDGMNDFNTVLMLDNISALTRGDENSKEAWEPVAELMKKLRKAGITSIFFHHLGKKNDQRGTSGREDLLNWSIVLDTPTQKPIDCEFTIKWTKGRSLRSAQVIPLKVKMIDIESGFDWQIVKEDKIVKTQIVSMLEQGKSGKEIASKLGVSEATVTREKKKLSN